MNISINERDIEILYNLLDCKGWDKRNNDEEKCFLRLKDKLNKW